MTKITSRPVRFLISGIGTALLFVILGWALVVAGLSPFAGTLLAYLIAFAVGYAAQRFWTFAADHPPWTSLPRYLALQVGCGLFSAIMSHATASLLGLQPFLMSLTTAIAAGAISYIVSARWVFLTPVPRTR